MFKILLALLLMTTPSWATVQWRNGTGANTILGTSNASDIDTNTFNNIVSPLDSLLANYREGITVTYSSASALAISAGSVMVSNSDGSIRLMLKLAAGTTTSFTDLDTGAESSSTTYYVYAIAASASSTSPTFKISASSTAPSGVTYYKRLGYFTNNGSSDITLSSIVNDNIVAPSLDIRDFASSTSSYTAKNLADMKMAYGTTSISSGSSTALSNLPFTSSSSYSCTASESGGSGSDENRGSVGITISSGSAASLYNTDNSSHSANWICIGS